MAVQGTVNKTSNFSASKFVKFAISLVLLVFLGLLIGFGVSSLLQKPSTPSVASKVIVIKDADSLSSQAKTYKSSGTADSTGIVVRTDSSNTTGSDKLIHALGTLSSWNGKTLTLLTDYGEIEITESPSGVYELTEKSSVSVNDSDYITSPEGKLYFENKSVTIGLTESGNKVYAKYIAVVEGGFY